MTDVPVSSSLLIPTSASETLLPYAVVAVALPLDHVYTYGIPESLLEVLEPGHAVIIPFGPRKVSGFVMERTDKLSFDPAKLKHIERLLAPAPLFDPGLLPFFKWTADYYHHPLGEVIRTALPAGLLVETQLMCTLTPEGRGLALEAATRLSQVPEANAFPEWIEAQAQAGMSQEEEQRDRLLVNLVARGPLPFQKLLEKPPVPNTARLCKQLAREGLLSLHQHLSESSVKPLVMEVYRPSATVQPRTLKGETQQAVLEVLNELGEADLPDLKEALEARGRKVSSLSATLKRLLELELIEVEAQERWREGGAALNLPDTAHVLTDEQLTAIDALKVALQEDAYAAFALHGVTGSGKTEVYLNVVAEAQRLGKGAIVLVPEIALTPQLVGRFRARFGEGVACLHSGMSRGERFDAWRRLLRGEALIAVGARSAIFAPVKNPGLFIVDEEHDGSFKQDSGLRYNARDLAVLRAHQLGGVVILGSATPSLETWANARRGRFTLIPLKRRVQDRPLPKVQIVDMTLPENRPEHEENPLSPVLEETLKSTVAAGQQAILLLNRRGYAPFVLCPGCGGSFRCVNCDISLTWHKRKNLLLCHYCGMVKVLPKQCPNCQHAPLSLMGQGTERLEHILSEMLPGVAIGRLDRDSVSGKEGHARILEAFRQGELQVLVGTQMVVKGHDFPNVTLVGILNADYALNLPDFRASERTFQLVTQVAGRAGRGEQPGQVIVQTMSPGHPSIRFAARHDAHGFIQQELRLRKAHQYPPFTRLALVCISAQQESLGEETAQTLARILRHHLRQLQQDPDRSELDTVRVVGPAPAPLARLQQWFRYQILIKAPTVAPIHVLLRQVERLPEFQPQSLELRVSIDLDPMHLL